MTTKLAYRCSQCAEIFSKWAGQCGYCNSWNSLQEETLVLAKVQAHSGHVGYAAETASTIQALDSIALVEQPRLSTGLSELDRVLGGGIVAGSVVLIGGDPGIGKSTLLIQSLAALSQQYKVLYVTGEESLQQVTMRAKRLQLMASDVQLLTETRIEQIIQLAQQHAPKVMVIDSIQTMHTQLLTSAPGGVAQVRESAAQLVQFAKQTGVALFVVGHVTKDGALAGPRVLEHMVDTVLYFEGQTDNRFRLIRAMKNRFGAVNELGVFAMDDKGLRGVNNPSAIFLSRFEKPTPGSVVMVTWEGSRPMLVEVQALVDASHGPNPRRVSLGLEQNRLAMLLAVLHKHGGVFCYDQDVFVNVVGGVRVNETAADLALILAMVSSLRNQPLPEDLVVFGEVGLAGEIRPVQSGQERLREAAKHGFKKAIVPNANAPKQGVRGIDVVAVKHLQEALGSQ